MLRIFCLLVILLGTSIPEASAGTVCGPCTRYIKKEVLKLTCDGVLVVWNHRYFVSDNDQPTESHSAEDPTRNTCSASSTTSVMEKRISNNGEDLGLFLGKMEELVEVYRGKDQHIQDLLKMNSDVLFYEKTYDQILLTLDSQYRRAYNLSGKVSGSGTDACWAITKATHSMGISDLDYWGCGEQADYAEGVFVAQCSSQKPRWKGWRVKHEMYKRWHRNGTDNYYNAQTYDSAWPYHQWAVIWAGPSWGPVLISDSWNANLKLLPVNGYRKADFFNNRIPKNEDGCKY